MLCVERMRDRMKGDDFAKEGEAGVAFGCSGEVGKGRVAAEALVSQDNQSWRGLG